MHIAVESWQILLQRHLFETQMNQFMPNVPTMKKFNIQHSFKNHLLGWGCGIGEGYVKFVVKCDQVVHN